MADPFRLTVLKAITTAFKDITVDAGYQHDLADTTLTDNSVEQRVFRGRLMFGEGDPVPMVSILEVPVPPEGLPSPVDSRTGEYVLELLIQGFVEDDHENPTDPAHLLLADVKKALAMEKTRKSGNTPDPLGLGIKRGHGNTITELRIGPGVVRPPDEVSAKAYFWLNASIVLTENLKDPFS